MIFHVIQTLVVAGAVAAAAMALRFKDLLASVVSLGVMSLLLSVEFYLLQAPDVAIAEAGVGAALTTAIYVISVNKTTRWEDE
jgi:energy-converting hydrogenase B subunit D